ncbi:Flp family type IVb pilin [bacterium M00.F.Ca.ET.228.01.1.1]|uniref:Flp/Fap pilin component n=2 Tax=unclassified Burkholderia TaxID=2613784 RepID=E1TAK0_BURSG|nr:Flp family type IVb pilin [Paraburkholderia phenoliruptrix]MBW9132577.1 Flp family type IVb pilin [Paraburkholderia ginsengiterrae]TGP42373.1 Flp family type IVb pilin [bacterium M00.F.Ca.ET.228.01.1.1]TGS00023.1 Flp family type IVb pilin [bacterium M00.F.Ca.ET.191.01.1.1]TGU04343.1 Flp family type IVb pilin [bacterium M00.F.Ca.ET.155.01.1.1]MBW0450148.1 Flp family type IVb pilin [Paraburkholderia phenoliruptrix]
MKKFATSFLRDNRGVTALEYGLIAGLIVVVIGSTVQGLGTQLNTAFQTVAGLLPAISKN